MSMAHPMRIRLLPAVPIAAAAWLLACQSAPAQSALPRSVDSRHLRVELIADRDQLRAGSQWLGLKFVLEPGWHLYWLNPGDSGGPPEVRWTLPPRAAAGRFEWPVPQRIDVSGMVNYGYLGSVVLPVPITIQAGPSPGPEAIRAAVRYLVCRDMCVSGQAEVEIRWPLEGADSTAAAAWSDEIARARTLVPKPAPAAWAASAAATKDAMTLTVLTGRREERGVFFPMEGGQIDDSAAQAVVPLGAGLRFELRKSPQLIKDPSTLRGVVAFPDGRAFEITAALSR